MTAITTTTPQALVLAGESKAVMQLAARAGCPVEWITARKTGIPLNQVPDAALAMALIYLAARYAGTRPLNLIAADAKAHAVDSADAAARRIKRIYGNAMRVEVVFSEDQTSMAVSGELEQAFIFAGHTAKPEFFGYLTAPAYFDIVDAYAAKRPRLEDINAALLPPPQKTKEELAKEDIEEAKAIVAGWRKCAEVLKAIGYTPVPDLSKQVAALVAQGFPQDVAAKMANLAFADAGAKEVGRAKTLHRWPETWQEMSAIFAFNIWENGGIKDELPREKRLQLWDEAKRLAPDADKLHSIPATEGVLPIAPILWQYEKSAPDADIAKLIYAKLVVFNFLQTLL